MPGWLSFETQLNNLTECSLLCVETGMSSLAVANQGDSTSHLALRLFPIRLYPLPDGLLGMYPGLVLLLDAIVARTQLELPLSLIA